MVREYSIIIEWYLSYIGRQFFEPARSQGGGEKSAELNDI